jgi:hypothetical protein
MIVGQVGQQIGDRRIDRDLANSFGSAVLRPRREQAFGKDVGIELAFIALRCQEDFAMLFEIHQPVWHGEVGDVVKRAICLERR